MKNNYFNATVRFMKEKGVTVVEFPKSTYDDWKNDAPHFLSLTAEKMLYIIEVQLKGKKLIAQTVSLTGKKTYPQEITANDTDKVSDKDGTVSEFFYELYNNIYNNICDGDDLDQDDYLKVTNK